MELTEIRRLLNESEPRSVRRVLPRRVIEQHIRQHLSNMQTMMQSFQAILTFPTEGRDLPQKVMKKMYQQFKLDLGNSGQKIEEEVENLAKAINSEQLLETYIMLDLVSETPFPFCILNDFIYTPVDNRSPNSRLYIPAYVVLWAQHEHKDQPIKVWTQLEPKDPKDHKRLPFTEMRSNPELVRMPGGQAEFYTHQTITSVTLYGGEPDEDEAFLSGKTVDQIKAEQQVMRDKLLRKQNQQGDFLHVVWANHTPEVIDYQEFSSNPNPEG